MFGETLAAVRTLHIKRSCFYLLTSSLGSRVMVSISTGNSSGAGGGAERLNKLKKRVSVLMLKITIYNRQNRRITNIRSDERKSTACRWNTSTVLKCVCKGRENKLNSSCHLWKLAAGLRLLHWHSSSWSRHRRTPPTRPSCQLNITRPRFTDDVKERLSNRAPSSTGLPVLWFSCGV